MWVKVTLQINHRKKQNVSAINGPDQPANTHINASCGLCFFIQISQNQYERNFILKIVSLCNLFSKLTLFSKSKNRSIIKTQRKHWAENVYQKIGWNKNYESVHFSSFCSGFSNNTSKKTCNLPNENFAYLFWKKKMLKIAKAGSIVIRKVKYFFYSHWTFSGFKS